MLAIECVENYIPHKRSDVEERLLHLNFTKPEARVFKKIYQLQQVPKAEEQTFMSFIMPPLQNLLKHIDFNKKHIKYLIYTHTGRVVSPFGQSFLQEIKYKLNLPSLHAFSVTLNNCASTITALSIAEQLLEMDSDIASRAIILTADLTFTPILQIIPNVSVMGDAVSTIIVNKIQKQHTLIGEVSNIYGRYAAGSWMSKDRTIEFEEQYVPMIVDTINQALTKSKLKLEKIQLTLPHNVNYISWEKIRSALKISKEKIYLKNISRYGHCFGADIFINYRDALNEQLIKLGNYYMMVTVGLGATVSVAIFQY